MRCEGQATANRGTATVTMRCGAQALAVSLVVVAIYRSLAVAIVEAGVPSVLIVLAAAAGDGDVRGAVSRRWASPRPGWWALFAAVFGVYSLPVLLFQAARANGTTPISRQ